MHEPDKPPAGLSLDLDNQWSYMKTHGDPGWESFPSYLDRLVPRVLDVLGRQGLAITVFVVGQDAALARNRDSLRSLAESGHEIGNHSFRHEPWMQHYSMEESEVELARAEEAIEAATGVRPEGFRGPGFTLSDAVLEALARRGYRYDATTLPTWLGPLARTYYFWTARLSPAERQKRKELFGTIGDALQPLRPYSLELESGTLLEIPVTTMPYLRIPFHVSYLLYLATRSPAAARGYFRTALWLCRRARVPPSLLLHPLDFLSGDDIGALRFFPAMNLPAAYKLALVEEFLAEFRARFTVRPLGEHARILTATAGLKQIKPASHVARKSRSGATLKTGA